MARANPFQVLLIFFLCVCGTPSVAQSDSNHTVAQELVGKWCYISRTASTLENITSSCITLNTDGSYEMDLDPSLMKDGAIIQGGKTSDAGTWWVNKGVFYYNSESQGEGSARFQKANHPRIENTPVLIVNGFVFAPSSPRDPW